MREIPDYYWEWTDYDNTYRTYIRYIKPDVPADILQKLIDDEIKEFNITSRMSLVNIDHETGQLIPIEEGVKLFKEHGEYINRIWREELKRKHKEQSPDYYWEWTEYDEKYKTYVRYIKPDVPADILQKLIDDEIKNFNATARIEIINIDRETRQLIPIEEGVKRFKEYNEQQIRIWIEESKRINQK